MTASRPVPWVSAVLYVAVLLAGGYAQLTGLGAGRPVPFLVGLAALAILDVFESRRFPGGTPRVPAIVLLAARVALYVTVAAFDGSGLSRVLFVLIPFTAYFAFGRLVSIVLGAGSAALVVVFYQVTAPHWYRDTGHVSDLLMFCVGTTLTIVMAAMAVRERSGRVRLEASHERLRGYAAQVAELSATAERNRLARDIHDELGHRLTAIALLLEKATVFAERDPDAARRAVADARHSARRALDDVRRSVRTLRAEPAPFRLVPALAEIVRESDGDRPAVSLSVTGDEDGYDESILTTLYRAAQEGITNARRHAEASRVRVSLAFEGSTASLVVADDGHGFAPGREGFGLSGMRERVRLVNGSVDLDSSPGAGTRVAVTIPGRVAG